MKTLLLNRILFVLWSSATHDTHIMRQEQTHLRLQGSGELVAQLAWRTYTTALFVACRFSASTPAIFCTQHFDWHGQWPWDLISLFWNHHSGRVILCHSRLKRVCKWLFPDAFQMTSFHEILDQSISELCHALSAHLCLCQMDPRQILARWLTKW